jgi:bacillithiol biosynthesis deacetylase BshB1
MKLDVLAIGAHPDDVELTCGGTIIKLVRQGRKVGLLDLTAGELGTRGTAEIRAREAADAARAMGVVVRENLGIPDGQIESSLEYRRRLIAVIRRFRPELLLFPYHTDRHPDHERAHVLCKESWFQAGLEKLPSRDEGRNQEPFRPRAYLCFMQWFEFQPTFVVDITQEFDQRMKTIRSYRSQFFDPESTERPTVLSTPDFMEMIATRAAYYGDRIGVRYGEPFFSPLMMRVDDLLAIGR